jgi:hypothetical protein
VQPFAESAPHATDLIDHFEELHSSLLTRFSTSSYPGGNQLFRNTEFLPALGAAARFELSKQYHVNLRADIAQGKDGHTFSMGVGEAF